MFTCLLIYSQCTLLRHLYNDELRNQKDAADANDLCAKTATLPGRHTRYVAPGCAEAVRDSDIDASDEAVRRWVQSMLSFNLLPDSLFSSDEKPLGATVPFSVARLTLLFLGYTIFREWFTPAVTLLQSGFNRFREAPAAA